MLEPLLRENLEGLELCGEGKELGKEGLKGQCWEQGPGLDPAQRDPGGQEWDRNGTGLGQE